MFRRIWGDFDGPSFFEYGSADFGPGKGTTLSAQPLSQETDRKIEQEHMRRVKGIAGPSKSLGVTALTSPVQPDGGQRQQRQTLLKKLEPVSKQSHRIEQSAQHLRIDVVQADKLSQKIPPSPPPKEVEDQDRQHTRTIVICHDQIARQKADGHRRQRDRPHDPRLAGTFRLFYQADDQQRDQKRP